MVSAVQQEQLFRAAIAADCYREAEARYWRRRAATLRWAQPRLGEYHGAATREDLRARWLRLEEEATACENRARVLQGREVAA